jgi:hypothetical protein
MMAKENSKSPYTQIACGEICIWMNVCLLGQVIVNGDFFIEQFYLP